jgi:hypothetical protein
MAQATVDQVKKDVEQLKSDIVRKDDLPKIVQSAVQDAIAAKTSNATSWPKNDSKDTKGGIEWKAKIKGFPKGTMSDEVEAGARMVAEAAGATGIAKLYAPGWRADKAFILFKSQDGLKSFLRVTRDKQYTFNVEDTEIFLTAVPHRSPQEWENSKETRLLVKTIAELGQIERTDMSWKTLYGDHKNKVVYIGREVVGDMQSDDPENPDKKSFKVHVDKIDAQVKKFSFKFSGEAVKMEFDKKMAA